MTRIIDILCSRHVEQMLRERRWSAGVTKDRGAGSRLICPHCVKQSISLSPGSVRPFSHLGARELRLMHARHEAGHLVAFEAMGWRVAEASAWGNEELPGNGGYVKHFSREDPFGHAVGAWAGQEAVQHWLQVSGADTAENRIDAYWGGSCDTRDIAGLDLRHDLIEAARDEAVGLVIDHWPVVTDIAFALVEAKGPMYAEELNKLLAPLLART